MSNKSAKGRAKNARNKLEQLIRAKRKGKDASEESLQYTLDEVNAALEEL